MDTQAKFDKYEQMLREWNSHINLVAHGTLDDIKTRHFADSAQLAEYIPKNSQILDMGSGAGFPGTVLAIMGYNVTCIESIGKKCRFLEALKTELRLDNLTVINDRVENVINSIPRIPNSELIFTARAFAPLSKILALISLRKDIKKSRLFLLKGRQIMDEIESAKTRSDFEYKLHASKTGDGFILDVNLDSFHVK